MNNSDGLKVKIRLWI